MRKKTKKLSSFLVKKNCFSSFILSIASFDLIEPIQHRLINIVVLINGCHFLKFFVISGFRYKEVRCIKEN
ncbi:hypothetical protein BpHYR1_012442 [Brachionus plicatilis]|uniref:Uncharacterized protein n=1 Tax=Brachionus plicatilis TaxID=10195 RepID=A0A3M7SWD1_BRAPC|nr:hypothetical protein BpHYR1_012442 [Brachionus plicatilis]